MRSIRAIARRATKIIEQISTSTSSERFSKGVIAITTAKPTTFDILLINPPEEASPMGKLVSTPNSKAIENTLRQKKPFKRMAASKKGKLLLTIAK